MKIAIETKFCQNLSKFQDKIEGLRRENGGNGGNSQPLRFTSPFDRQEIALTGFVKLMHQSVKQDDNYSLWKERF